METPKPAKKPGRPPKSGVSVPTAQRSKAYRARQKAAKQTTLEAASMAHEDLKGSNTCLLMLGLQRQLESIMSDTSHAPVAREIAAMIILELCDRHEIRCPGTPQHQQST